MIFKNKGIQINHLLIALIIISFIVSSSILFLHSMPEYSYTGDSTLHMKWIDLLKEDWHYINYRPFDNYPNLYHLINALIGFVVPSGIAMALINAIARAIIIVFSFKLALTLLNQDKAQALIVALIASLIDFNVGIPVILTPLPQTLAIGLMIAVTYYFLKNDWLKAGIILGIYSIIHVSFYFVIALIALIALIKLFKNDSWKQLIVLGKSIALTALIFIAFFGVRTLIVAPETEELFPSTTSIMFHDAMISPLSFLTITIPYGMILIAFTGLFFYRRNSFQENKAVIALWFLIPLLLIQLHWIYGQTSILFAPPQRILCFALFPLAFLSSIALMKLKRHSLIALTCIVLLGISMYFVVQAFNKEPLLNESDLELIDYLKEKGIKNKVIVSSSSNNLIEELSFNRRVSQRDRWLTVAGHSGYLTDENRLDFFLLRKGTESFPYDKVREVEFEFENNKWLLLRIIDDAEFRKAVDFRFHLSAWCHFVNSTYPIKTGEVPYFIFVKTIDSREHACLKVLNGINVVDCPSQANFMVSGERKWVIELFNSFDLDYFELKLLYMYRNELLFFEPSLNPFGSIDGERDLNYSSFIKSHSSGSDYSKPNEAIMKLFWGNP